MINSIVQILFFIFAKFSHVQSYYSVKSLNYHTAMMLAEIRRLTGLANATCTNDPFLWTIHEIETDEVVAHGFGTMHVPREYVLSDSAWESTVNALSASCGVYIEPDFELELMIDCIQEWPKVSDIQNEEIRAKYSSKINELNDYLGIPSWMAFLGLGLRDDLPIISVVDAIARYNTPELKDSLSISAALGLSDDDLMMDLEIHSFGRPKGGLEDLESTCKVGEEYVATDEDLEAALYSNYTQLMDLYQCGDIEVINQASSLESEENLDYLLNERNTKIVERMVNIIENSVEKPFFAVGVLHWKAHTNSIEKLLLEEGYYMERVTGEYNAEALSDLDCDFTP